MTMVYLTLFLGLLVTIHEIVVRTQKDTIKAGNGLLKFKIFEYIGEGDPSVYAHYNIGSEEVKFYLGTATELSEEKRDWAKSVNIESSYTIIYRSNFFIRSPWKESITVDYLENYKNI